MSNYKIVWEIELNASNPVEAAEEAMDSLANGTARCFTVQNTETLKLCTIDLDEDEGEQELPLDKYETLIKP
jgi:hypothetical protein